MMSRGETLTVSVHLTRQQIEASPDSREDEPCTRELEARLYDHYGWDRYWGDTYFGPDAIDPLSKPIHAETAAPRTAEMETEPGDSDPYLRGVAAVKGYHVHATDGDLGHVETILADDVNWDIRYLIIATRTWLPGKLRERVLSEVDALRKSLAVELRLQIAGAFGVYDRLRELSSRSDGPISARMVESKSRMPAPIIYSANAGKIGLLEGDAMGVVIVYMTLEGARDGADRLATTYRTPDDISPAVVMATAQVFLAACDHARGVLPRLRTGDASYDAQDEALIQKINAALAARRA